jgi:hypothetical protein
VNVGSAASGERFSPRCRRRLFVFFVALAFIVTSRDARAQQVGHKTEGTLGLNAGVQLDPGIYFGNSLMTFRSNQIFDRYGNASPAGLDLSAVAGAIGVSAVVRLPRDDTFYTATIALPDFGARLASVSPLVDIHVGGLSNLYVQPVRLGWRARQLEVVTGFGLYVPTGQANAGDEQSGVGHTQWGFETSLGGTAYFDAKKTWLLTALWSYEVSSRKLGIDVRRGDVVQVQGGAGKRLFRALELGVVGYALWQVTDHGGSALPASLQGSRDRAFSLGPEASVVLPLVRSRLTVRYEHEFGVEARPLVRILFFGLATNVYSFQR